MTWPNLFIAGAQKAGTTTLWRWLGQHPQIFMSRVKEPMFFSHPGQDLGGEPPRATDEASYLALFDGAADFPVRGEASPSYLQSRQAPLGIAERVPDARVIVSLREPVQRAWSQYLMDKRAGIERRPFMQVMQDPRPDNMYVQLGLYADGLRRFRAALGSEHVLVTTAHRLHRQPGVELAAMADFLGVDSAPMNSLELAAHNRFRAYRPGLGWVRGLGRLAPPRLRHVLYQRVTTDRRPEMPTGAQAFAALFAADVEAVEAMLGPLPELHFTGTRPSSPAPDRHTT